jgi:hypothetical protein
VTSVDDATKAALIDQATRGDVADRLAEAVGEQLFDLVAQWDYRVNGRVRGDWESEDPELTGADPGMWPVIVVNAETGERVELEVEVRASLLGSLVDDQQRPPALDMACFLLEPRTDDGCALRCGTPLIVQWVSLGTASGPVHADCADAARKRASHPEWFTDTKDQQALIEAPGQGGM